MAAATLADMRLVVTAFVTLDGIIEAPGFDEHRSGRNAWALRFQTDEEDRINVHGFSSLTQSHALLVCCLSLAATVARSR